MAKFMFKDRPSWMVERGILGFQDGVPGETGAGIPRYMNSPGYAGSALPRVVGARWFCGEACGTHSNEKGHAEEPDVVGNLWTGGKAAYQKAVEAHHVDADDSKHRRALAGKGVT